MDLSFARADPGRVLILPTALAVLLAGVAARQAASQTARVQATLSVRTHDLHPLAPVDGAFHAGAAAALTRWQAA